MAANTTKASRKHSKHFDWAIHRKFQVISINLSPNNIKAVFILRAVKNHLGMKNLEVEKLKLCSGT